MKKETIYFLLILVTTSVVFACLTFFTPLIHDDFAFLYKYGPKAIVRPTDEGVKNIVDVFESQYYFYQTVNGRFSTHFLLQFVLLLGKNVFNLLNVLVFMGLILLIHQYSKNYLLHSKGVYVFLFILFSIWFFTPYFGQTMLWAAGSLNYLWSSCLVILFIYLFRREEQNCNRTSLLKVFLFFVFSFMIGNTNEAITFGVSAALLFFMIFNIKKLTPNLWAMITGFGVGMVAIVFSPGTISRANNDVATYSSIQSLITQKTVELIGILFNLRWSLIVSIFLLVFLKVKKTNVLKIVYKEKLIIFSILFNGLLLLAIGNVELRMLYGVTILIALFNAVLVVECLKYLTSVKLLTLSVIILCFLGFSFYNAISQVNDYRKKTIIFTNQLKNKAQKVFYFPEFKDSRFVYHTIGGITDSKNYHNRVRSFHYGLSEFNIVPVSIYHEIYDNSILLNKNNWSTKWSEQLLLLKNGDDVIIKLPSKFRYNERLSAKLIFSTGEEKSIPVSVIPIKDGYYAFLKTKTQNFDTVLIINVINDSGIILKKIEKSVK